MKMVFIRYFNGDSKFVNKLAKKLTASGIDNWIDMWIIKIDDSITDKINEGNRPSYFLIVARDQFAVNLHYLMIDLLLDLFTMIRRSYLTFRLVSEFVNGYPRFQTGDIGVPGLEDAEARKEKKYVRIVDPQKFFFQAGGCRGVE